MEVRIRVASAIAAMARPNRIWRCNTISFASKLKLYKTLVTSILLYGCETCQTLLADYEKEIQAFETKCPRKLLRISYLEHKATHGCGARSVPLWVHRNLLGNFIETETCIVRACHMP